MINILVVEYNVVNAVTWWRFWRPFSEMQQQYPGRFNFVFKRELQASDLFLTDIFILSRPNTKETLDLIERIRAESRAKIILDIDDAITNLPLYHDQAAYHRDRIQIARQIFSMVDWFWVSTEQLLFECDCIGRGEVIPNAIYSHELPDEPAPDKGLWVWRGRALQKEDVYQAGFDMYEAIKGRVKQFIFWGCLPSLDHLDNVTLLDYEPDVQSYFAKLRAVKFNGVWKPLVINSFNDSKSNISWIEATMSGGICLTNYAGRQYWENAVSEMPDYSEACEVWAKSKERIIKDFNLIDTARQRAESIERLMNRTYERA